MTALATTTNGLVAQLDGFGSDRDFRHTGRLSIDFALTGGEGEAFAPLERLRTPQDVNVWLAWSQLAVVTPLATDHDHLAARQLRWAIWHALEAALTGTLPHDQDRAIIDAWAAQPPLVPQLFDVPWVEPVIPQAFAVIARDAIELLRDPFLRGRLRRCASPDCGVPFADVSRPGQRRWCEDQRCGDRARQRALRARRSAERERRSTARERAAA